MKSNNFVPKGAASFLMDYDHAPRDVYFLLLPKLTMLAFSAAVEPLRIANQITNKELYRWFILSEDGLPVPCSNGIEIVPNATLDNLARSEQVFVCAGIEAAETMSERALSWLRRQRAYGCRLGSICTGAFALAKIGVLEGRRFTLHWENQPAFIEHFPDLVPTENLYEVDGDLMTCGGGSAATDMMLDLIERGHGRDLAAIVSDMCIHFRSGNQHAVQKSAYSVALRSRNQHLIKAMQVMNDNLEEPMSILEISEHVGISRRQLERLFVKNLGTSPVQFYIESRISRAHALLNETKMSVAEISAATGFNSATQMSQRFRLRYGTSPSAFRKSWAQGDDA
ncbi:GlxA family transcriptional regulator [Halocynthiibacter namhaensis]|uniref:GlxA family transcriptional regulator n=1 Tax=Halocynthiibacter namhaensis TaxID=1290553 RepID=UPI0005794DC5|nr:GlxA family transcriptional regulator [Halocynthiibacter namhaensis]